MTNKIAEVRNKKKMTQKELALIVGISRPYVSNLENFKFEPTQSLMKKIADALEDDVMNIFFSN